jgi:hypothetical protein
VRVGNLVAVWLSVGMVLLGRAMSGRRHRVALTFVLLCAALVTGIELWLELR